MQDTTQDSPPRNESRRRFLDAAVHLIRARGYEAATIDDLCRAAELDVDKEAAVV